MLVFTFCILLLINSTIGLEQYIIYHPVIRKGHHLDLINVTVDNTNETIILFPNSTSKYPYRISAYSQKAQPDYPIFVVVRQQKEVTSWEIPLLVESEKNNLLFWNTSRTLCHNYMLEQPRIGNEDYVKMLSISISTFSAIPVLTTLKITEEKDFYIELNKNYTASISPSSPKYFYYKYLINDNDPEDTILLDIKSFDDTCLIVSLQSCDCPVFDLNENIKYDGQYQTINTRGGIIIKKKRFPNGFFIIFVSEPDNYDCDGGNLIPNNNAKEIKSLNHTSTIVFSITEDISQGEYVTAIVVTLVVIAVFSAVSVLISCLFYMCEDKFKTVRVTSTVPNPVLVDNSNTIDDVNAGVSSTDQDPLIPRAGTSQSNKDEEQEEDFITQAASTNNSNISVLISPASISRIGKITKRQTMREIFDSIKDIGSMDIPFNKYENIDLLLCKPHLRLSDLATQYAVNLNSESINFFWHVISIGIFYGTPVIQLALTHQRIMDLTGNLDMCYYNFLCAHPLIGINDFNHIFSNAGYIIIGVTFIGVTFHRHRNLPHVDNCGIPKHYGLFYAMGTAIVLEGAFSLSYHICPSQENFQFDTSFMYVIAILCLIKLYENRHPDINATAYIAFLLLSFAVWITAIGIFENNIIIWSLFIAAYWLFSIFIALKIYYINNIKRGYRLMLKEVDPNHKYSSFFNCIRKPTKKVRFWFSLLTLLLNILLSSLGFHFYLNDVLDFGTFLLLLLMANTFVYTAVYIICKGFYKEKISFESKLYLILSLAFWITGYVIFLMHSTEWKLTAAESRQENTHCKIMNFYDFHDLWHILSAAALFFSCMLLLTIDNDLIDVPHTEIYVF